MCPCMRTPQGRPSPYDMAFLRPLIQLLCSHILLVLLVLLLLARASVRFDAAA